MSNLAFAITVIIVGFLLGVAAKLANDKWGGPDKWE